MLLISVWHLQWCRNRGGQGGHWPPQYLADQLTLFEPGRADYPHLLLLAPSMFFTFRHHCIHIHKGPVSYIILCIQILDMIFGRFYLIFGIYQKSDRICQKSYPKFEYIILCTRLDPYVYVCSDAGRWKTLRGPVVIGGDNLPSPVRIGLTDLPNIGGASGPPGPPGSGITVNVKRLSKAWEK